MNPKTLKSLRISTWLKIGIIGVGVLFFVYAFYLRSIMENERPFIIIGLVFIIIGAITFLFGESEEKISREDDN